MLPDRVVTGDLLVEDGIITQVGPRIDRTAGELIDGRGLTVLPGVIDSHVHFRDPGSTHKEDLASGSRACAAGGVTSFLDMPNTRPPTISVSALEDKLRRAAEVSVVNYGFFIGATKDNLEELANAEQACGIKIYMGSSTGDLLLSEPEELERVIRGANKIVAVHAEDEVRLRERQKLYDHDIAPAHHTLIRDVETALTATRRIVGLAQKHGQRLHLLHISSEEEINFLADNKSDHLTCEVCPHHLFLNAETAYERLGTKGVVNPPLRNPRHVNSLWKRVLDGTVTSIASDHAPHTVEEKNVPYCDCPSGMPGVEWMLPLMLNEVARERISLLQVVKLLCAAPASCYRLPRKGRLEAGYDADLVLVDLAAVKTVGEGPIHTACKWSPYEGFSLQGWPVMTVVLGNLVFRNGEIIDDVRGGALTYARKSWSR